MDTGVLGMLQSPCWVWSLEVQQRNFRGTFSNLKILKGRVRTKGQGVSYQLVSCCFEKTAEISRGGREAAANLYLPHTPLSQAPQFSLLMPAPLFPSAVPSNHPHLCHFVPNGLPVTCS